ncbi:MAG: DUF2946 family protein [Burkholderiaceae bacterium]
MDEIVRQALAKWPNVPDCYGWLALDARGMFRMRDAAAQAAGARGDIIRHSALLSFIHRNYQKNTDGAWYFQNGPQRVYVQLEQTPFVARSDPAHGFVAHDGNPLSPLESIWITQEGRLILGAGERIAMIDDRDLAECLPKLSLGHKPMADADLLAWLTEDHGELQFTHAGRTLMVHRLLQQDLGDSLGFQQSPQPKG